MPQPSQSPEVDASVEEVRVAMALNGGVSLAVWMGGCAVELDSARRAHLAPEHLAYDGYEPGEAGGTRERRVYHGLCRAFGRRLSIDILTGASAGGVNGALLSAAMVSGRRLHPKFVRDRWLELGDLSRLLHDPGKQEPRALMDGELFHRELLRAFRALRGETGSGSARPDTEMLAAAALPSRQARDGGASLLPDLDVTMTDVVGAELTFTDEWELPLVAREHAPRFKFRSAGDYTAAALADAARASASFPIAFEPVEVQGEAARLAGLPGPTYGIDGGLLDNAPIRAALELIPFRPAATRVRRYACYMNADPVQPQPASVSGPRKPAVDDVLGYVLNLPRTAPFAGQLYAVRDAVNRPLVTQAIVDELLRMDLAALEQTANALLPAYRRRRTARSIEELVGDPARARQVRESTGDQGAELPWIPNGDAVAPPAPDTWDWGIRPAQRILHLLLDLLRVALGDRRSAEESLLELRARLDQRIAVLERIHTEVAESIDRPRKGGSPDDAQRVLGTMATALEGRQARIYALVTAAAGEFAELRGAQAERGGLDGRVFAALFQPSPREVEEGPRPAPLAVFFRRVLAIEVLRRALSDDVDVDTAQKLSFVQLTPSTPTPILSETPLSEPAAPAETRDKLTGVGLAHFAGFYRRAWRANDFMWGRLDAAARVVDLLLDQPPEESDMDDETAATSRATLLVDAVLGSDASEEERWLVQEALADCHTLASQPFAPPPREQLLDTEQLRRVLQAAIRLELTGAPSSPRATELPLTRAVCARAAQLEAIRDELPVLVSEAAADGRLGSSGRPLDLGEGNGLRGRIEALRRIQMDDEDDSLPKRLTGRGEAVSRLGLQTISRAVRVGISMLESTAPPLAGTLGVLRVPALAVSGVVARERLHRLTAMLAFTAAAIYSTSRIVTAQAEAPPFSDVWSLPVLLSLIAALVVLPAIAVPALQAAHGIKAALNASQAFALTLCGGVAAAGLALWSEGGGLDLEQVLLAPGAENPPEAILVLALAATAGLAALRLPLFSDAATQWLRRPRAGTTLCILMIAVSLAVAISSSFSLYGEIDGGWWRTVSVVLAFPGALLAAAWFLKPHERLDQ